MAYEGKARVLTNAEFMRAEKAAMLTRHGLRNKAMLYMSFAMALRACELRRLRIRDVLSPDGTLLEEINLLSRMTKAKKQRHVYLTNKKARKVLMEYIDSIKKCAKWDDPLFKSQKGGEFLPSDIVRVFTNIFKLAGLANARSHSGRRTFITAKINDGFDIRHIAIMVGHENINTTVGYHDENPDILKKIAEHNIF